MKTKNCGMEVKRKNAECCYKHYPEHNHPTQCDCGECMPKCNLCNGTGYFKSNTAEYEGDCPNGCHENTTCCKEDKNMPPTTDTHTKTPWEVVEGRIDKLQRLPLWIRAKDQNGHTKPVAMMGSIKLHYANAEANAAFIVRACNHYAENIAAMNTAIKDIENGSYGNALSVLRFAIAKSEGL